MITVKFGFQTDRSIQNYKCKWSMQISLRMGVYKKDDAYYDDEWWKSIKA